MRSSLPQGEIKQNGAGLVVIVCRQNTQTRYLAQSRNVWEDARAKRNHNITVVVRNDTLERRHRALDGTLRNEAENTQHGKTSIVDLRHESPLLLLIGHDGITRERVVQIERPAWNELGIERRVVSDLTPAHVMRSALALAPELEETDEHHDLPLGRLGNSIPRFRGVVHLGEGISSERHWPWPGDAVGMYDVSNECKHGHATVLDLGFAEEADGRFVGGAPEFAVGESEGVEVLDEGIGLGGEGLEIGLGFRDGRGGGRS
mmetsp:Transcript_11545/g.18331  ORF Transcript_11545/g.18331 Transcript_11545/m.18331 type:complete len:261 (-) Transcript_11545:119-901(-)